MKHYLYNIIVVLAASFFLNACKKQLNVFPTTFEADENLITDQKSAKTALNGIYYCLANTGPDYNNIPTTLWYNINEMLPSTLSGLFLDIGGNTEISDHMYLPGTFAISPPWDYGYKIINAANGFIKNIGPTKVIPENITNEMIAEARFLRAFANSNLLFYYGEYDDINSKYGIILRTDFVTAGNINQPRSSVKETYEAIISDLDYAIDHLPALKTEKWYVDVWCAKLLKARILVCRGETDDYTTAIALTTDIIENGPFVLEDNVKDIFLSKGFTSNEVMLGIQPYNNQVMKNESYAYYHAVIASDLSTQLFQDDPRNEWVFRIAPDGFMGDIPVFTKYYPGSVTEVITTPLSENCYVFRLTEAYLLKAEAIIVAGGSIEEAKDLLKTTMQHSGFSLFTEVDNTNTREELQLLIIKEVMKNFAGESGQDWFAIRRLPLAELQSLLPSILSSKQLVLPIPVNEMTRNSLMIQNPGY